MNDLDHTALLLKVLELEEKIKQFELERVELTKAVKNLSLYLQVQDI